MKSMRILQKYFLTIMSVISPLINEYYLYFFHFYRIFYMENTTQKHRSFHMPRLLKDSLNKTRDFEALSIKRQTNKQRFSIHKSKI